MSHEVIMPALGMAQETGKLLSWLKDSGDPIKVGDILFEVETDKSTMEVEAQADGYLTSMTASAGDDVPVGSVIAIISDNQEEGAQSARPNESNVTDDGSPEVSDNALVLGAGDETNLRAIQSTQDNSPSVEKLPVAQGGRILASPKAKRLANERGLDLAVLVSNQVPQPYHVHDLEKIQDFASRQQPQFQAQMPQRIEAEVNKSAVEEFLQQLLDDASIEMKQENLLIAFAAKQLRSITDPSVKNLVIEVLDINGICCRYSNADHQRASQLNETCHDTAPMLTMRNYVGTAITSVRFNVNESPVLTISDDGGNYILSLDFYEQHMPGENAVTFVNGIAASLANPLQQLV